MTNQQLKLIRLYLGMTQKEFANYFGLAESTIAKIEVNIIGVSDVTRAKILRKFDVDDPEFIEFCAKMAV